MLPADEATVLRRAGLSVLTSDYEQKSKSDTDDAMKDLSAFQRQMQEQIAHSWSQYHIAAEQARAEQEKEAISALVTKELDRFRAEQQKKEEKEEERLRHLYRGIMGDPADSQKDEERLRHVFPRIMNNPADSQPEQASLEQFAKDQHRHIIGLASEQQLGGYPYPMHGSHNAKEPLIYATTAKLMTSPCGSPRGAAQKSLNLMETPLDDLPRLFQVEGRANRHARVAAEPDWMRGRGTGTDDWPQPQPRSRERSERHLKAQRLLDARSPNDSLRQPEHGLRTGRDAETQEVERLLSLNRNRLERLSRLRI